MGFPAGSTGLSRDPAQHFSRKFLLTSIALVTYASQGLREGAARVTGRVIAVDGGFTTVRPLVK